MPEISRFFGIMMYFDDHAPPHFHAVYGNQEAQVGITPIRILEGGLPARAASMVFEWAAMHQAELMANWERLAANQGGQRIDPLS